MPRLASAKSSKDPTLSVRQAPGQMAHRCLKIAEKVPLRRGLQVLEDGKAWLW